MNVHQMSVTYVMEQDRILLRISSTEAEVQLTPLGASQQLRLHFREKPEAGTPQRGFQLELAPQLSHGLVHLLERALQHAQWGLDTPASSAEAASSDFTPLEEDRPKYLN